MVRTSWSEHLRDIPSYCLNGYEEEVPSTGSQVEDEETRDSLGPGQLQTDPEEQQQRCKSSQTQHCGLRRERETTAVNPSTLDLVIMNPWAGDALTAPSFLDEVPESQLLLAART